MKRHPKGKGCWYFTYETGCAICSTGTIMRERRWGKKPKDPAKRYEFQEFACSGHFL